MGVKGRAEILNEIKPGEYRERTSVATSKLRTPLGCLPS
jgi:hypothetical protein